MDGFSYVDIFATKGFEYLLVIGFFLVLVAFWSLLNVPRKEIREAEAERAELRRLLDFQRERMEAEMDRLRSQRDTMQGALLAQIQLIENKALAAWHEAHPGQPGPTDLGNLLDWVVTEHGALADDKKRLDYLAHLVPWEPRLYRKPGADGLIFVDAADKASGDGLTLREAIDAARSRQAA